MTYSRVEQAAADPVEDPDIDKQRKSKAQGDVHYWLRAGGLRYGVGHLSSAESEEQEQESANKFTGHRNEVST